MAKLHKETLDRAIAVVEGERCRPDAFNAEYAHIYYNNAIDDCLAELRELRDDPRKDEGAKPTRKAGGR